MALQYLDMMKSLATSDSTKWVVPMELTSFVSSFARNMAGAASGNDRLVGNGGTSHAATTASGASEPAAGATATAPPERVGATSAPRPRPGSRRRLLLRSSAACANQLLLP